MIEMISASTIIIRVAAMVALRVSFTPRVSSSTGIDMMTFQLVLAELEYIFSRSLPDTVS
ncbi:hypothetical protein D3C75_1142590 [compost metagenome]